MRELKELGIGIVVILIVVLFFAEHWIPLWPERFTVRYLLLVTTVIAVLLGVGIALNAVIVGDTR